MSPQSVSRFVQRYPGVEGFYFINRNADLGFIRPADAKPVKETFPQLHDRQFMRGHPGFVDELESFLRDLQELSHVYFNNGEIGMDLGYVIPAGDGDREWKSATLMAHDKVIDAIRTDQEVKRQCVAADLPSNNLAVEDLQGACSVHRGINYLANYVDTHGTHGYFPALFFQPALSPTTAPAGDLTQRGHDTSLRVINLRWRSPENDGASTAQHDLIFDILRHNLEVRGAIARNKLPDVKTETSDPLAVARQFEGTDLQTPR